MKTLNFENREDWFSARRGKITGSRLKDVIVKRGTTPKIGFYELIAERLAIEPDDENAMARGQRLEEQAIERFEKETGQTVDKSLVMWTRDDNESIAVSPDGFFGDTNAVEVKCLNSAKHLEAFLNKEIPSEYKEQATQYFIVNEKLQNLYFIFFDPRIVAKDYFTIAITREQVEEDIEKYLAQEMQILAEVTAIVNSLSF